MVASPGCRAAFGALQARVIHLVALCAVLERGYPSAARIARLTTPKRDFPRLDRPQAVWEFWTPAHLFVRAFLD